MTVTTGAEVVMWGTTIGYVSWNDEQQIDSFQYEPKFLKAPVDLHLSHAQI